MLKVGDTAPDFDATDCQGRKVKLSELKGKKVVLFFFPKAFTPACTIEIRNFRVGRSSRAHAGDVIQLPLTAPGVQRRRSSKLGLCISVVVGNAYTELSA